MERYTLCHAAFPFAIGFNYLVTHLGTWNWKCSSSGDWLEGGVWLEKKKEKQVSHDLQKPV